VTRHSYTRHLHFDGPLVVKMNGRTQQGAIFKPGRGG
jgi:hypothetical protein